MRQWLNSTGNNWFQKQNTYDVKSESIGYSSGWMTGFSPEFLELVMPVYNKTARSTVPSVLGGGGGGYDITLDKFWLISAKELNGVTTNEVEEGYQLAYFRDVANTTAKRIQYDDGGVARDVWTRSADAIGNATVTFSFSKSGKFVSTISAVECAFLHAICVA